jgi:para-aminobenzoate synthetase component 1
VFDAADSQAVPVHNNGNAIELPWRDPVEAFLAFAGDEFVAFLHSGGTPGPRSRYSYLCIDPCEVVRDASLDGLAAVVAKRRPISRPAPVPFAGGAVGFFSYDSVAWPEGGARSPGIFAGVPDMQFGIFDLLFAWDHAARRCWLLDASEDGQHRADAALHRLRLGGQAAPVPKLQWRAGVNRDTHMARVARTLDYIRAGDIYQANITAPFEARRPERVRAADIFAALQAVNPAPFSAFIACGGDTAVASVSPERFLRLDAQGTIEARPIKGTRPRGATPAEDAAHAADLLGSEKDRAENLMIVDLLRNDISRVASPGSVGVPVLCGLESFASVHHLVSVVEGRLRPGLGAIDLLQAALPGGSITGAPKIRAMQIIAELEGVSRGPYCGSAAWIGFDGAMDSNILIRTLTVANDCVVAQAGGGIVADSDPAAEWDELMVKIAPMLRALGDLPA